MRGDEKEIKVVMVKHSSTYSTCEAGQERTKERINSWINSIRSNNDRNSNSDKTCSDEDDTVSDGDSELVSEQAVCF